LTLKEGSVGAERRKSQLLWQGRSWQLNFVQATLPDDLLIEDGVIDHPGSVVVVPLDGEDVLMVQQYRLALDEAILELPAGTRETGEDWLGCAKRELREETGHRAETWTPLGHIWPAPGLSNELMAVYLASDLSSDPLPSDADEVIEVRPLPLEELVAMARDGRLQDAKSALGLLRAAAYLEK
jgi:ADP-ribose pyrophosphatase